MKPMISGLAVAVMLAAPMAAQQTSGSITATVDLEQRAWSVGASDGKVKSGWRQEDGAVHVTLAGGAGVKKAGALALEFAVASPDSEAEGGELTVTLPRGEGQEPLVATPENSSVTITALHRKAGEMIIAGDFTGVMVPGGSDRLVQSNAEGAVTIDGNFQATVQETQAE